MAQQPGVSNVAGIRGLEVNSTRVEYVSNFIELTSNDGSVTFTGNNTTKTIDFSASGGTSISFECDSGVAVGELVAVGAGILIKAKADDISTMPCIGIVTAKSDSTHCNISQHFIESSLTGIVNKKRYFVSSSIAGKIDSAIPTGAGSIIQNIAEGIGTDNLIYNITPTNIVVRA